MTRAARDAVYRAIADMLDDGYTRSQRPNVAYVRGEAQAIQQEIVIVDAERFTAVVRAFSAWRTFVESDPVSFPLL